ncbi:MAG TPA: hypothetical protein VMF51_24535 [Nocardioides sp.]|uniref:hypothetical protein n=1 Tax=Nocardioides sp. TaxID=35761 RepID=UPI002C441C24|nr:hypothetical protein [Nocardioides sp.]HTW18314.1 hypothetical protein [Nocardioides sp.]
MSRLLQRAATGLCAGVALGTLGAGAAAEAVPSSQAVELCGGSVPCSVQADSTWIDGLPGDVAVTGRPGSTVGVRAFRVGGDERLTPFGPSVEVTTDGNGFGRADLTLPRLAEDEEAGPLLLALEDSRGADLTEVLGTWTVLASRSPLVLGDGYGMAKPVGTDLALQVTAALPGTILAVEIERDGRWESAGGSAQCPDATTVCELIYQVPRGLDRGRHQLRLVDTASGIPVATWAVLPSDAGQTVARRPLPATPMVGADLAEGDVVTAVPRPRGQNLDMPDVAVASTPASHDPVEVRRAAIALAGLAALAALLGVGVGVRRRLVPARLGSDPAGGAARRG